MNTASSPGSMDGDDMRRWLLVGQFLFVVTLCFAALPTGFVWDYEGGADVLEGSWVLRVQWSSVFAFAGYVLYRSGGKAAVAAAIKNPFVWLLLSYCMLSVVWSPLPVTTIKRTVQFFGVLLIGIAIAHVSKHHFVALLRAGLDALSIILFLSVLAGLFFPDVGRETLEGIEGSWRGILLQKNALGIVSAVSLLMLVALQTMAPSRGMLDVVAGLATLICLVMSRSSTSLFLGLSSVALYAALHKQYIRTPLAVARLVLLVGLAGTFAVSVFFVQESRMPDWDEVMSPISAIFGKSTDLTGRTEIWEYLWVEIERHPLFGLGYGSFWMGQGSPSDELVSHFTWTPNSGHNGYLDTLNELGLIGFGLFAMMLVTHLFNLVKLMRIDRPKSALHSAVLGIFLVSNATESSAMQILVFLQVVAFLSMAFTNQHLADHDTTQPGRWKTKQAE